MKLRYKLLIMFLIMIPIVYATQFTPQGDINLRSTYSIINAVDINATRFFGDGSGLTGVNGSGNGSGTVTSVSTDDYYLTGGPITSTGTITFNESILNTTIDARGGTGNCSVQDSCSQVLYTGTAITVDTVNTGQGANFAYPMDQSVLESSAVTFATVNTGQGANELYDMDQNVLEASDVIFSSTNVTVSRTNNGGCMRSNSTHGIILESTCTV